MSNCMGRNVRYTIFGESHGPALGMVMDNLPPGFELDLEALQFQMNRRKPGQNALSTARNEADTFEILSGFFDGKTTGAPLCAIIRNNDQRSGDYKQVESTFRPSHSDYAAHKKYNGHNDVRGGGAFSGRLTAALVLAGSVARQLLAVKGIECVGHILKSGDVSDQSFETYAQASGDHGLTQVAQLIKNSSHAVAPMLRPGEADKLFNRIEQAKLQGDAVGGTVEIALTGLKAGYGNPYFESLESELAKALFSIPGVKGVSFGAGFDFADKLSSEANDVFQVKEGKMTTATNNSGGINGGISNGMPIVFQTVFRPTPTISKVQHTVNREGRPIDLSVGGRHDPCIFLRGLPVVEAVANMVLLDLIRHEFNMTTT